MVVPETRASLLIRIRDCDNCEAWEQFVKMYRHVIYRMAIAKGMQPADADDLTQQVLCSVSQSIERFEPDGQRAKFRTWLQTIARRAIINALTRVPIDRGEGGSDVLKLLNGQPSPEASAEIETAYRREIFLVAAAQIQHEFQADTWQSFWRTVMLDQSVEQVSASLGRSCGNVYTARCRVMKRLKEKVQQLDEREDV